MNRSSRIMSIFESTSDDLAVIREVDNFHDALMSHIKSNFGDIQKGELPNIRTKRQAMTAPFFWNKKGELTIPASNISPKYKNLWIRFSVSGNDGFGKADSDIDVIVLKTLKGPFDPKYLDSRINKTRLHHEFTHYLDSKRMKGKITSSGRKFDAGDVEGYFNDPGEVNAYYHEALGVVHSALSSMGDTILSKFDTKRKFIGFFDDLLDRDFKDNLQPKYRKKIIRRISKFYDEVVTDNE